MELVYVPKFNHDTYSILGVFLSWEWNYLHVHLMEMWIYSEMEPLTSPYVSSRIYYINALHKKISTHEHELDKISIRKRKLDRDQNRLYRKLNDIM